MLKIYLPANWEQTENEDGPDTFAWSDPRAAGALQVSLQAQYAGGEKPDPDERTLVHLAESVAMRDDSSVIVDTSSGSCAAGIFGSVVARSQEAARLQVWIVSDGWSFAMATHICLTEPSPVEVSQAQFIVRQLTLQTFPDPPKT